LARIGMSDSRIQVENQLASLYFSAMSSVKEDPKAACSYEWHCLRTQRKREHIAASILQHLDGIEVFNPRISQVKKTRSGKKRFVEALFPSYIFAKFCYAKQFREVTHSQGVVRIVQNGDRRVVPEAAIAELKESLPNERIEAPDPSIQPGAEVQVLTGGLKGLNGKVIAQLPATNRVDILLDFLGREITVAIESSDIYLAGP
jgi:transcriptional antiterminator RfaH